MRARVAVIVVALVMAACGGEGRSVERLCDVQAEIAAIALFNGDSPDEVRETVERLRGLADEMVEAAPDDALAAAESSHDAADAIWELLESVDYDETRVTPTQIETVALGARDGSADLLAWAAANCEA